MCKAKFVLTFLVLNLASHAFSANFLPTTSELDEASELRLNSYMSTVRSLLTLLPENQELIQIDDMVFRVANVSIQSAFSESKWTDGIVYYEFDAGVTQENQQRWIDAANEWSIVADLRFVRRTTEPNYIYVKNDAGNWSYVGMVGGKQEMGIFNWGMKYIIAHEIGHALGLIHEHSRSDRDDYVSILWNNVEIGKENNFEIDWFSSNYGEYDFDSVMHYPKDAFSDNGDNTIEPLPAYFDNWIDAIGQRTHLSIFDKKGMLARYLEDEIRDINSSNLHIGEWGTLSVEIIVPEGNDYYVRVWDDDGFTSPEWEWAWESTSSVSLDLAESYTFSFSVKPDDYSEGFEFWLYKKDVLGLFKIIDKVEVTLYASDPPDPDTTPPTIDEVTIGGTAITDGGSISRYKTQNNEIYAEGDDDQLLTRLEILINGEVKAGEGPFAPGEARNVNYPWNTETLSTEYYAIEIRAYDHEDNEHSFNFNVYLEDPPPEPILVVSPAALTFNTINGGSDPENQYLTITNGGSGILNWSAIPSRSWITLSASSGTATSYPTIYIDSGGLSTGTHAGEIRVTATGAIGSPKIIPVTLTIHSSQAGDTNYPVADAYIGGSECGNCNYGSDEKLYIGGMPLTPVLNSPVRSLIKFNISSFSGKSIGRASLRLYCNEDQGDSTSLYACSKSGEWDESTVNYYNTDLSWYTCSGSTSISAAGWQEWNVTDEVQSWVDGVHPNNGFFMRPSVDNEGYLGFSSREGSNKPELVVEVCEGTPDLILSPPRPDNGSTAAPFFVDQTIDWYITVTNQGTGCATEYNVRYFLGDSIGDYSYEITNDHGVSLFGGESTTEYGPYKFFNGDLGTKYLIARIEENGYSESFGPFEIIRQPSLAVDPTYFNFTGDETGDNPSYQEFNITNIGDGSLNWALIDDADWLTVVPSLGTAPSSPRIFVDISGLTSGTYNALITVAADGAEGSPREIPVTLTVHSAPGFISLSPASNLSADGAKGGPFTPYSLQYIISNPGGRSIFWSASKNVDWISLSSQSGILSSSSSTNVTLSINSNANHLSHASYEDTVTFTNITNGIGTTSRQVNLIVTAQPGSITVTPAEGFTTAGVQGGRFNPESKSYTIENTGGESVTWSASKAVNWITMSLDGSTLPPGGSVVSTVSVNTNADNLAPNSYFDTISFLNDSNGSGNTTRSVSLTVYEGYAYDINNDFVIDIFDLVLVSASFGRQVNDGQAPSWSGIGDGSPPDDADVNNDGLVDIFDLVLISTHFGEQIN